MPGILLTTDLSEESLRAFEPAKRLAERLGAKITLASVIEDLPVDPVAGGLMGVQPDHQQIREDWAKQLASLAEGLGVTQDDTVVLESANVAASICECAKEIKADYIAMATHGRSGLRRMLFGSVAEDVVRHATVPVLLYPPSE